MKDTREQVRRIAQELHALSQQLQWKDSQNSAPGDQTQILDGFLNGGPVEDLRKAVDQVSHVLWCYIESVLAANDVSVYAAQCKELEQIASMLRLLHPSARPSEDPRAFLQRSIASVEQCLETHYYPREVAKLKLRAPVMTSIASPG